MRHWKIEEERALLAIVQKMALHSTIDGRRIRNRQAFQYLSEAMAAIGYDRPPDVCRNKLKTLRLRFVNAAKARARSGAGAGAGEELPNEDLLQELLGRRLQLTASSADDDLCFQDDDMLPEQPPGGTSGTPQAPSDPGRQDGIANTLSRDTNHHKRSGESTTDDILTSEDPFVVLDYQEVLDSQDRTTTDRGSGRNTPDGKMRELAGIEPGTPCTAAKHLVISAVEGATRETEERAPKRLCGERHIITSQESGEQNQETPTESTAHGGSPIDPGPSPQPAKLKVSTSGSTSASSQPSRSQGELENQRRLGRVVFVASQRDTPSAQRQRRRHSTNGHRQPTRQERSLDTGEGSRTPSDRTSAFVEYLMHLMRDVPPERVGDMEMELQRVVRSYL